MIVKLFTGIHWKYYVKLYHFLVHRLPQVATHALNTCAWKHYWIFILVSFLGLFLRKTKKQCMRCVLALFSQHCPFLVTSVTSEGHSATQSSREPGHDPDPPEPPRVYFILLGGPTTISSELESSHSSTMSLHLCRHLTPKAHHHNLI